MITGKNDFSETRTSDFLRDFTVTLVHFQIRRPIKLKWVLAEAHNIVFGLFDTQRDCDNFFVMSRNEVGFFGVVQEFFHVFKEIPFISFEEKLLFILLYCNPSYWNY